jgi:hypothetical protein
VNDDWLICAIAFDNGQGGEASQFAILNFFNKSVSDIPVPKSPVDVSWKGLIQ